MATVPSVETEMALGGEDLIKGWKKVSNSWLAQEWYWSSRLKNAVSGPMSVISLAPAIGFERSGAEVFGTAGGPAQIRERLA